MTLNDPELMVREWLEKLYALAGPGADMAAAALVWLDEQDALLEEKCELIDAYVEGCGELDYAKHAVQQFDNILGLAEQAELIVPNQEDADLVPLLRMFLPV